MGSCLLPAPALGSPAGAAVPPAAPCSTLFVANLGQFVSEHELKEIFGRFVNIPYLLIDTRKFMIQMFYNKKINIVVLSLV